MEDLIEKITRKRQSSGRHRRQSRRFAKFAFPNFVPFVRTGIEVLQLLARVRRRRR